MEWLYKFPSMQDGALRDLKKMIDEGFRAFTRAYGGSIEGFFTPLQHFLIAVDRFMTQTPWPVILVIILALVWFASRSLKIMAICLVTLMLIGYFDMWTDTMRTISMIFVCTLLSIAIGLPAGILMARSDRVQRVVNPILDVMQTMPSFVYLIPVVMLLGIGKVPGLIAVVIYAIPPMIRLTNLGIRLVDPDVLEAAGIRRADLVAAVTGADETNLVVTSLARQEFNVHRVIARVNNPKNAWLFTPEMGCDVAVNQAEVMAKLIIEGM